MTDGIICSGNEKGIRDKKNAEKVSKRKLEGLRLLVRPTVYTRIILIWISNRMEEQRLDSSSSGRDN
jgi:hypothetical protein